MSNPAFAILAGSDKADGPAAMRTGGLYGLFSRYIAERPFSQSLALQTFFFLFLVFFLFLSWGKRILTNQGAPLSQVGYKRFMTQRP